MNPIPLPNRPKVTDLGNNKYELAFEPLFPGYGITIGNALRRVLLSSMEGAAATAVKIKFADHEFSTIPHVKEDVLQIILNLKQLRLKTYSTEPIRLNLKKKTEGPVLASDITLTDQVEIANPDLVICHLDSKSGEVDMDIIVEQGRGYVPVEAQENENNEVGMLGIDAIYTPVKAVYYDVSNVRVGQMTNFDKLIINIETDGTISGEEALDISSRILVDHFKMLFTGELNEPEAVLIEDEDASSEDETAEDTIGDVEPTDKVEVENGQPLDELQLSNRAKNALTKNGIETIEGLQALTNDEIQNMSGLGEKTIAELMQILGRE